MPLREELVLAYKVMVEGEEKLVQLSATERKAMQEFVRGQQEQQAAVKGAAGATGEWGQALSGALPLVGGLTAGLTLAAGAAAVATAAIGQLNVAVREGVERQGYREQFTALLGSADAATARLHSIDAQWADLDFSLPQLYQASQQMELFGLNAERDLPRVARAADLMGADVTEVVRALDQAMLGNMRGLKRYGIDAREVAAATGLDVANMAQMTAQQSRQVVDAIMDHWDARLQDAPDTFDDKMTHLENRMQLFRQHAFERLEPVLNLLLDIAGDAMGDSNPYPGVQGDANSWSSLRVSRRDQQRLNTAWRSTRYSTPDDLIAGYQNQAADDVAADRAAQRLKDEHDRIQAVIDARKKAADAAKEHAAAMQAEAAMAATVAQSFRMLYGGYVEGPNGQRAFVPGQGESAASLDAFRASLPQQEHPFDAVGRKSPAILEAEEVQKQTAALEDLGFDHFTAVEYAKEQVAADVAERRAQIEEAHQARILSVHKGTVAAITQVEMTGIAVLERGTSMLFAHRSKAEKDRVSNAKLASMEMQALVLDEVSNELMTQAKKWAIEGAVHIVTPGKQAQGAAELAGALAAGAGAGVFSGLAGNIRAREQELAQSARDQAGLGTPGQSQAERDFYNRNSGGGGGSFYTPSSPQSGGTTTISVVIQASYFTGTRADADRVVQDIKGALDEAVGRGELPHVQRAA